MAVTALLAFLSPSYWLYYAAIVGSVVAVSKARNTLLTSMRTIYVTIMANEPLLPWNLPKKEFFVDPTRVYDQMPKPVLIFCSSG